MPRIFSALLVACLSWLTTGVLAHAQPTVRGEPAAIEAAEVLLRQVGGREVWRKRTFIVEEIVHLGNGETGRLWIGRDFERGARLLERTTPTQTYREWVAPEGGWIMRNGELRIMDSAELTTNVRGRRTEPYAIYHRLARNDPALRFELRDNGLSLFVFDGDERLLCWFRLASNGTLRGWGNFYNGRINEHHYGPLVDRGDANVPQFGAEAEVGGFRFEYTRARLRTAPLEEPARDAPFH